MDGAPKGQPAAQAAAVESRPRHRPWQHRRDAWRSRGRFVMAPSNYAAIADENRTRYGTDIGRIGPMLLADRYDDRTHFIFELLQNAEDALGRRGHASGPRKVTFTLTRGKLTLSHFGRPFNE